MVEIGEVGQNEGGSWRSSIYPGRADLLLQALDPTAEFVLIETSDGEPDWHEAVVSVSPTEAPRPRLVRRHSFDLLVTPEEAAEIGDHLHESGRGFLCFQFRRRPTDFDLPDYPRGRADAMRGQGVELSIDLPHDGDLAVVVSPSRPSVEAFLRRLA